MIEQLPTTERLARALEAANDPALAPMIERARAGHYDDFKSQLDAPITALVRDLRAAGHLELAQRARDGEFDSTPAEGAAWWDTVGKRLLSEYDLSAGRKTAMD
jgi:hypothetical protein